MARQFSYVVVSGTAGPEAMVDKSFPTTSEMTRQAMVAGKMAAASRPPLNRDKCFLMVFISWILAPHFKSVSVVCCLSARVIVSAGMGVRADPPPEIRLITSVFSSAVLAR